MFYLYILKKIKRNSICGGCKNIYNIIQYIFLIKSRIFKLNLLILYDVFT